MELAFLVDLAEEASARPVALKGRRRMKRIERKGGMLNESKSKEWRQLLVRFEMMRRTSSLLFLLEHIVA
jgi:hypothetical protein